MLGIGRKRTEGKGRVQAGIGFVWDRSKQTWVDLRDESPEPEPRAAVERGGTRSPAARALAVVTPAVRWARLPGGRWRLRAATAFVVFVGAAIALTGLIGIGGGDEEADVAGPAGIGYVDDTAELSVSAPTNRWVDFYSLGSTLDGEPVPAGSAVTALDPDGVVCGAFSVTRAGAYGVMAVYGDDPDTAIDEGAVAGDRLEFLIDGVPATAAGPDEPVWTAMGMAVQVNLAGSAAR